MQIITASAQQDERSRRLAFRTQSWSRLEKVLALSAKFCTRDRIPTARPVLARPARPRTVDVPHSSTAS